MDVVHVAWDRCAAALRPKCTRKEGYPTLCWNVHVTAAKRILSVSGSYNGATNDKTIVKLDKFSRMLKEDPAYTSAQWPVYVGDGRTGYIRGSWTQCDGGYHNWVSTISAFKHNRTGAIGPWSAWMEAARKNVECVFGIMKKRHRILRLPFLLHEEYRIDNVFRMCCILHNRLLHWDGLANIGEFDGDWVSNDLLDTDRRRSDPNFSFNQPEFRPHRLDERMDYLSLSSQRCTDGPRPTFENTEMQIEVEEELGFEAKRMALIKHFSIAKAKGEVGWLDTASRCRGTRGQGQQEQT